MFMTNTLISLDIDIELPPACKRRRGFAGSIVSTAVNAALIGTAVGLTVYRLWRGRGKEHPKAIVAGVPSSPDFDHHNLPPPPPYQEREWSPTSTPPPQSEILPAPTPRKKVVRHNVKRPRRARVPRTQVVASSPPRVNAVIAPAVAVAGPSSTRSQPEFDFGRDEERAEEEGPNDQMDWIQDKLAQLIEEGKRALNREVVVMSDAKEDEFDDGTGVWEEEAEEHTSLSRASSLKRAAGAKRSRHHVYGSYSQSSHHLPQTPAAAAAPTTPGRTGHSRGFSSESVTSLLREDDGEWQSPELRASMQKARERILASRTS